MFKKISNEENLKRAYFVNFVKIILLGEKETFLDLIAKILKEAAISNSFWQQIITDFNTNLQKKKTYYLISLIIPHTSWNKRFWKKILFHKFKIINPHFYLCCLYKQRFGKTQNRNRQKLEIEIEVERRINPNGRKISKKKKKGKNSKKINIPPSPLPEGWKLGRFKAKVIDRDRLEIKRSITTLELVARPPIFERIFVRFDTHVLRNTWRVYVTY